MMGPYGWGFGMMGGYSWLGGLMMLALWALVVSGIVLVIVWMVRSPGAHGSPGSAGTPPTNVPREPDEAVAIARRRFASGEISKEQFDEIMQGLGG